MRRTIAIGILACFLLSSIPVSSQIEVVDLFSEENATTDNRLIPDSELTLPQIEALNSAGLGRSANSNWSVAAGSNFADEIYEMILDSNGNVVICGSIYDSTQFGSFILNTAGQGDILLAKLSKTGSWMWAVTAGTAVYYDECRGVTIDSNDNVYGTGYFNGEVTFGNTTLNSTGFDGWIARVNSTGQFDWAIKFGGDDVDVGWDLAADNNDNLYVTGYYQNFTEFSVTLLSGVEPSEDRRFFIAYYNVTEDFWDWARDTIGTSNSVPYQIVVEPSSNSAYVAGYHSGYAKWGENGGGNYTFTSDPQSTYAGFVLKYADNGFLQWGRKTSGPQCATFNSYCGVYFNNVILHPDGGIVVGGNFLESYTRHGGSMVSGQGNWDVLIVRYDTNGTHLWDYYAGGNSNDRLQSLSVNPKGQVQFGGTHYSDMMFGSTSLQKSNNTTFSDGFIAQVDFDSDFQWAMSLGGAANDTVGALLALDDGTVISGGDFSGTVMFGDTPRTATDNDIFVWVFQHDKDDDGVSDYTDNCLNTANTNQSNFDSDLRGDACDTDDDNDGLHDALDDCRYGLTGWNQSNTTLDYDADGCSDIEEDDDDDNDGVLDNDDNCPSGELDWVVNSSNDIDGDGCLDSTEDVDDDADGILDNVDNCHYTVNPLQLDYDEDGAGDLCDQDDDGDGVSDIIDDCNQGYTNWTSESQTDKDEDGCEDDSDEDVDDDNDGILDVFDSCARGEIGWNSTLSNDRDRDGCRNDNEDNDNDNDSVINEVDLCRNGITNWRKNSTNDNDGDGCIDDREDTDDDNDGFTDVIDFCPLQEGGGTLGGMKGCPDFDSDGWADAVDAFFQDETQWNDGDKDGFGDNPNGNNADDCPFFSGNSSKDRIGCIDTDGDGYSDPDLSWSVAQGADAFVDSPDQWEDADRDGYGDNFDDPSGIVDFCTNEEGTSTVDRYGCPDIDGDGYSDQDEFWGLDTWDLLGYGPDAFPIDSTQWYDTDEDGFGDNWGNPDWNDSRNENWPGVFVENATSADMCPLELPDGRFDDDVNYPGCLLDEPSDGGKSTDDGTSSLSDDGISTTTMIGIIGGVVAILLSVVIAVMLKKKPQPKKPTGPKSLTDLPMPAPPGPFPTIAEPAIMDVNVESNSEEDPKNDSENVDDDTDTVASWEGLPAGDYLDPDENGTVWFRANDGSNWYQNADESWTKWND